MNSLMDTSGASDGQYLARRSHAHLAPYGNSCSNCVKNKTKCTFPLGQKKCERCNRLQKDCQAAPKKRISKRARLSPLTTPITTPSSGEKGEATIKILHTSNKAPNKPTSTPSPLTPDASIVTDPKSYSLGQGIATSTDDLNNDEGNLDEMLETYRTNMVPCFPIAPIPKNVTMDDLKHDRPFTWLVIRAICCKTPDRQLELGIEVRKRIAVEMLLEATRSLDLLVGLLIFGAWSHYYIWHKHIETTIIQLATSMACDLGLTRPVPGEPRLSLPNITGHERRPPLPSVPRTLEERRAIIGLFLHSSVCSNYFQRVDPMPWTPYLEECLQLLESAREYSTDILLVYLTRAHIIGDQVAAAPWKNNFSNTSSIPPECYIRTLQTQLDQLNANIPLELRGDATLQLHLSHTGLLIHEHSLSASYLRYSLSNTSAQIQQLQSLWNCIEYIKDWFSTFYSLDNFPLSSYPHMSASIFLQAGFGFKTLFRLSTFEAPHLAWDRHRVRQELNFGEVASIMADRYEDVAKAAGIDVDKKNDSSFWLLTKKRCTVVKNWWEVKIAPAIVTDTEGEMSTTTDEEEVNMRGSTADEFGLQPIKEMDVSSMDVDFLDDAWMKELLTGESEFGFEPFW